LTALRPYNQPPGPLTGGARFIRGFTRIGAVVAVLVALIGVAITFTVAINAYNTELSGYTNAQCVARLARSGFVFKRKYPEINSQALDYEVSGCSDYGIYGKPVRDVIAIADARAPIFVTSDGASALGIGLIITGICAVVAYILFWVVGWVLAGFTRDA
jgi:hypothetical protein